MGAATAQVVQMTAVVDEVDTKVGTAIATIGSNMPEMGRGVRELAALMPDERRRGNNFSEIFAGFAEKNEFCVVFSKKKCFDLHGIIVLWGKTLHKIRSGELAAPT